MNPRIHITRHNTLTGDDSPVGIITPQFIGQEYITKDKRVFKATDLTNAGWVNLREATGYATKAEVNVIKEDLSVSENTKYSTENGVKEFSCKNGYVDNVVIEGKTLVNLHSFKERVNRNDNMIAFTVWSYPISNTKQFTASNFNSKSVNVYFTKAGFGPIAHKVPANSSMYINIAEDGYVYECVDYSLEDGWTIQDEVGFGNVVILEGDHTDKPISYFEGLKSVGQGDKIEVLTTPIHNNLIPQNYTKGEGHWSSSYGSVGSVVSDSNWYRILEYIPVKPNTQYTGLYTGTQVIYYDENKNVIYHNQSDLVLGYEYYIFTTPQNAKYIRVSYPKNVEDNICIFEGIKHDKKTMPVTLRSLPNGIKDTIEKRGNKYVKVQRCGEVVLNENSNIQTLGGGEVDDYRYIVIKISNYKYGTRTNLISDKFKTQFSLHSNSVFGEVDSSTIYINLKKTLLTSLDINGAKTWLQSNPVTIVYELAIPIITELPNFNPQTYGDTTLLLSTGAIQGECEFEVTNSKGSEIEVLKDKVSSLDCDYVEDIELEFLNGWVKNTTGYHSAKIINGVAYINLLCSDGIKTVGTPICYIKDQKHRPKTNIPIIIGTDNGLYVNAFIQVAGNIVIDHIDIPPNLWISICVSYPIL